MKLIRWGRYWGFLLSERSGNMTVSGAVGEGLFLGCSGTDLLRWALALVAGLTPIHLLDAGAASRFLMPSTFAAFLTSGALTHRRAP